MAQKMPAVAAPKPYTIASILVHEYTRLPDLIDEQSRVLFMKLGQREAMWLRTPWSTWSDDPQYLLRLPQERRGGS